MQILEEVLVSVNSFFKEVASIKFSDCNTISLLEQWRRNCCIFPTYGDFSERDTNVCALGGLGYNRRGTNLLESSLCPVPYFERRGYQVASQSFNIVIRNMLHRPRDAHASYQPPVPCSHGNTDASYPLFMFTIIYRVTPSG